MKKIFESVPLEDAFDLICDYYEDLEYDYDIVEHNEKFEVFEYNAYIHVPELEVHIHEYEFRVKRNKSNEYKCEFTGLIFRNDETNKIVYDGGYNNISDAMFNGFNREVEFLKCDVYVTR